MPRYVLEDEAHAEWLRFYDTADAAISELRRLVALTSTQLESEIGPTPCADHCGHRDLHVIEETGKEIARPNDQPDVPRG